MFAELPLSTRILLVLNTSIFNIMTKGSLWGCLTPLALASLKDISWSFRHCLNWGIMWTLFTCHWVAFLRDLNNLPIRGPPEIVFISPMTSCGGWRRRSSLPEVNLLWFLLPLLKLLYFPFFTYFCSFPFCISSSIYSFKSRQSSV